MSIVYYCRGCPFVTTKRSLNALLRFILLHPDICMSSKGMVDDYWMTIEQHCTAVREIVSAELILHTT